MADVLERIANLSPEMRALLVERLSVRARAPQSAADEPVAIIGIGCSFPGGATTPEAFWQLLKNGVDTISEVPPDRWAHDALGAPNSSSPEDKALRWGGFLEQVDEFDAEFFSVLPREAERMDPQQRLLLEVAWEALEGAGQSAERIAGTSTGVFIGIHSQSSDYYWLQIADPKSIDTYTSTGGAHSIAANRLSYFFDLRGPSVAVDTACSSSLVAVHLACRSLQSRECDMALAGGVNLILSPEASVAFSKLQMLAPDGRCKTFDAQANGFVRGEGCGLVVLKRLSDARADGDPILALVRGSAVNQDGHTNGLTAPNGLSQQAVIRQALAKSGVDPSEITYIEAHGTGTRLGDPIEVEALAAVIGQSRSPGEFCALGSVKTNIGHLEAAAGIAGLIKVVLALQHETIPPHLHFHELNPHISLKNTPFKISAAGLPWPARGGKRQAGVSSFGFGGTNAHVVLQEATLPQAVAAKVERPIHVLALSAKSEAALPELAKKYAARLSEAPSVPLADLCFTAGTGRSHFDYRLAVTGNSVAEAEAKLKAFVAGEILEGVSSGRRIVSSETAGVAFLFTGQGAQYPGMGRELYENQPTFRKTLQQCDEILRPYLQQPLLSVLYAESGAPSPLDDTAYTQPALFAIEYSLAELWRSWGIEPAVVMGHSVGEYVAACIAGVFDLEEGLRLIAERGRLQQALPRDGEMAAVFADVEGVAAAIRPFIDAVSIAAINNADNVVISGARKAVREVLDHLGSIGVKAQPLKVSHAFHSPLVEPMLDEFERIASQVSYRQPKIPLISTLTGQILGPDEIQARYWRRHAREAVRFATAMETLRGQGCEYFVEIGPSPTLLAMGRRCLGDNVGIWLPSLRKGQSDWLQMLESLGALYTHGAKVDWSGFDRDYPRRRVELPTYPFQRSRYWLPINAVTSRGKAPSRWDCVIENGRRQARQAPLDLNIQAHLTVWRHLDNLAAAYIVETFRKFGVFQKVGERQSAESLIESYGILPAYRRLIERWLTRLANEGILERFQEDGFISRQALPDSGLQSLKEKACRNLGDNRILLNYLQRCGENLTAVLTGKESPLETLFPGGSHEVTEYLYDQWAVARYFNNIARSVIEGVVATHSAGRPLRVLEIGAGTGGTTASLLPALDRCAANYWYTDVSDFFLGRARERFNDYSFVRYRLLDIESDPTLQQFPPRAFDVVVAANVLHATPDLNKTLENVRTLLAPGGLLVLYEVTRHPDWFDMTIGLIEGWQKFADDYRRDNPLLSAAQWQEVLRANGFDEIVAFPQAGASTEALGQHIVVARYPESPSETVPEADGFFADESEPGRTTTGENEDRQGENGGGAFLEQLAEAMPNERKELLVSFVRDRVAKVLRTRSLDALAPQRRLLDLGLDSLMAVELRNQLAMDLGLQRDALPATLVFDYPTIQSVGEYLSGHLAGEGMRIDAESAGVDDLTDGEITKQLAAKLDALEASRSNKKI